ncbi:cell division protein FtsZ [Vineibacter terrae]|uniref:Cell division protein FtsZ n=1 Tax=Vineibacter terrae TaxID=2586908 RepID=A0A5C8PJ46_9HYPH|nr:cell division protein FtsZ [Vineibacter terrae]TXL73551.1 cell division protein FtsZ [Vineibacter terrae]
MTISLSLPQSESDLKPRITVIGVGGAGGNAVNNMISSSLEGVEFVVANTDAQALGQSLADRRIQLGISITQGLGAGARPGVGKQAAEEALPELMKALEGSNMVFVTAGMGGGTGTGAAPVIAQAARDQGILTVGVVTKPFHFEGRRRMAMADDGIIELEKFVDTLIIIPNQNLFKIANEKTTFADAFKMADDVLYSGVRGVTDLMVMPGLINLDFADIRTVMGEMGKAMMGTGEAEGSDRAKAAAEAAISNPLLEDSSMKGAKGVLINITGGLDMTLLEVDEAANRIREEVDPDADIIFGSTFDAGMQGRMRVSVVATGISAAVMHQPEPKYLTIDRPNLPTGQPHLQQRVARPVGGTPVMAPMAAYAPAPAPMPVAAAPAPAPVEAAPVVAAAPPPPVAAVEPVAAVAEAPALAVYEEPMAAAPAPAPHHEGELPLVQPAAAVAAAPAVAAVPPAARAPSQHDWRLSTRPTPVSRPAAAAAATAASRSEAARSPNIFQRITGLVGGGRPPGPAAALQVEPVIGTRPADPPAPAPTPLRPVASAQPKIAGLDSADRAKAARDEDDLQIPAFLRRQAN